jgi:hypothetical protein
VIRLSTATDALPAGSLVVGYARAAYEDGANLIWYREQIAQHAAYLKLLRGTTFVDVGRWPATKRPGFRALVDVVSMLQPRGVMVPSPRHLSANPGELSHILALLHSKRCAVLVVDIHAGGVV